jgi:hypothetical protein
MHCYWLDKTEKYNWPFSFQQFGESYISFGSEPLLVDLDNDGKVEISK